MNDLADEILRTIKESFDKSKIDDAEIKRLKNKIKNEIAHYEDAYSYAIRNSELLSNAIDVITEEMLPNGTFDYELASKTIKPLLKQTCNETASYCKDVQNVLNKQAHLGLKAIKPNYDSERADGICKYIADKELNEVKKDIRETSSTLNESMVDQSIRRNADFHYNSGLHPKIVRTVRGGCCEWCSKLAGSYDYEEVSDTGNDVFRRHRNCHCLVEYVPVTGKKQNVHTKRYE